MASSKWKTFDELKQISLGRSIVFWGASTWIEQTLENIDIKFTSILDNNKNNIGTKFIDVEVVKPKTYLKENKNTYVVITTKNYESVIEELHEIGLVMGDDFCVSPILNGRKAKDDFLALNLDILISSPEHASSPTSGGGLYSINTITGQAKKLLTGKGRGLVKTDIGFAWIDMLSGIKILNNDFDIVKTILLPKNCEAHGLWFDSKSKKLFVGLPGRDSIGICGLDSMEIEFEISISEKWHKNKKDNHHVNDLCVIDSSLYVSMFSFSGNWPLQSYDGGIMEFDWKSGKKLNIVASNIWMPHSVMRVGANLTYLDSMRGKIIDMNYNVIGKFDYFIRGMDVVNRIFALGVSEHRYPEKLSRDCLNIPLDSGVLIFDSKSKMSKLISMKHFNSIHSVLIID